MSKAIKQQILISGLGGQGVLFITSLLAEAAINKGLPVFTSDFKVGDFSSPLIRPFQADGLLILKDENITQHGFFLKKEGWAVVNSSNDTNRVKISPTNVIDADRLAQEISNPKSVNLIVLGFALFRADQNTKDKINLFCSLTDIKKVLRKRFNSRKKLLGASLLALETGYRQIVRG
ncbi:MAG: 2-oxoacid:acceptor oxidoreductase family protein [Desulfobacterales bacterium]